MCVSLCVAVYCHVRCDILWFGNFSSDRGTVDMMPILERLDAMISLLRANLQ